MPRAMRPWPPSFSLANTKTVSPSVISLPPYIVLCAVNANVRARGSITSALTANIMVGLDPSTMRNPTTKSKAITQAPKKDIGVTVVVRHDTVPEQSDVKIADRPETQRERYNVRDVPSGSWPVLIDRAIKAESCTH